MSIEFPNYSEKVAQGMLGTNPLLDAGLMGFLCISHTEAGAGFLTADWRADPVEACRVGHRTAAAVIRRRP